MPGPTCCALLSVCDAFRNIITARSLLQNLDSAAGFHVHMNIPDTQRFGKSAFHLFSASQIQDPASSHDSHVG